MAGLSSHSRVSETAREDAHQARLDRERAYFDAHYDTSARDAQMKYYAAIEDCRTSYMDLVTRHAAGGRVLEFACGTGETTFEVAPVADRVVGIDISAKAVERARAAATERGVSNVTFEVMDAQKTTFEDESFDLIAATGVIHHMDVEMAFAEVKRLLKPSGVAVFVEALGHNPAINAYRALTPAARSDDEAPLKRRDLKVAERLFDRVDYDFFGLTTLASVFVRSTPVGRPAYQALRAVDGVLLRVPGLRWGAWTVLMQLRK